jgi:adenosylcobyric acid synthase
VPRLARIANFDDFDPLRAEPDVELVFVPPGQALPGDADLVILPGSKATIADLADFRAQGWHIDLLAHHRRGGRILGLCAGYQMLGNSVADPGGVEGPPETVPGLGLLDVATTMAADKVLQPVTGAALGMRITGYEMHMGVTSGPDTARPMAILDPSLRPEGAISKDALVMGCTIHGLFAADGFRRWFLATLRPGRESDLGYETMVEETLDALADHLEAHLDLDGLLAVARGEPMATPLTRAR